MDYQGYKDFYLRAGGVEFERNEEIYEEDEQDFVEMYPGQLSKFIDAMYSVSPVRPLKGVK